MGRLEMNGVTLLIMLYFEGLELYRCKLLVFLDDLFVYYSLMSFWLLGRKDLKLLR